MAPVRPVTTRPLLKDADWLRTTGSLNNGCEPRLDGFGYGRENPLVKQQSSGFESYLRPTSSTHDQVARALGADILSGVYQPGTKLPSEQEIIDRFGISRTVLREVFKTMTAKGLIVSKTRVGTTVRDSRHWNFFDADVLAWRVSLGMDDDFRRGIAEARLAVEPRAAQLAATRATPQDIATLRATVQQMRDAVGSRQRFAEADLAFHQALAAASGNFLLNAFSTVTEVALVASFLLLPLEEDNMHEETVNRHERVVDAIEAGASDEAGQLLADIIDFGAIKVARSLARSQKD